MYIIVYILILTLLQADGESLEVTLADYKYSPDLDVCLFSITKSLTKEVFFFVMRRHPNCPPNCPNCLHCPNTILTP